MLHPTLSRGALETKIEAEMLELAETLYGDGREDLQKAHDFDPVWFGGQFPAEGAYVRESRGTGGPQDRGDRPTTLEAVVLFFYPCLPNRGLKSRQEDGQQEAKRVTRSLRDRYFLAMQQRNPRLYAAITAMQSRGAAADEFGVARVEENRKDIVWVDRTILEFLV